MKCISCESEINPKFKHALDINVCPFCGEHIMEEHLKNCLAALTAAMADMVKYPEQLSDWLLSNHNYIKTDSPDIGKYMPEEMLKELKKLDDDKDFQKRKDSQKFTVKVKTENGEEEIQAEKIQSEERTNDFFKRAEVIKTPNKQQQQSQEAANFQSPAERTQHLKKMAQQIKKEGSKGLTNVAGGSMMISPDMLADADPSAVEEFQQMIAGGEVASSIDTDLDDDLPGGDFILQANMAAAQAKNGGGSDGGYNAKDAAALQKMQAKINQSRKNINSGSKGSFSRG